MVVRSVAILMLLLLPLLLLHVAEISCPCPPGGDGPLCPSRLSCIPARIEPLVTVLDASGLQSVGEMAALPLSVKQPGLVLVLVLGPTGVCPNQVAVTQSLGPLSGSCRVHRGGMQLGCGGSQVCVGPAALLPCL